MKTYDINAVEQQLQKEDKAAFLTKGASMQPLLRTNKDIVVIKRPDFPLKVGDVPLYKKRGIDKLVLHRIIGIQPDGTYITRGDNTYHKEYVKQADIVGVMVELYRDGKYIDCSSSKKYKRYVKINRLFYPIRWVWNTKIRTPLGKLKRKILPIMLVACLCLSLTACTDDTKTISSTQIESTANDTVSKPQLESAPQQSEVQKPTVQAPQQSVPPVTVNTGKKINVTGKLDGEEYSAKIEELQSILNGYTRNISLSVYAIDGSRGLYYNTEAEIFGACTVKAGYTLYACKQMENGNGNLQTQIIYEQKHYEPGTGDMQYSPLGTVFSMETALNKSMSISDNVGYLMAVDYFGREGYNKFINDLGCPSLAIKPTVWSLRTKSGDLIRLWCEIYDYFKTDSEYSKFLYNSCTNTAGNYATAALSGVDYSHKQGHNSTGDWKSYSDAGIVWKGDTPYVIAILTDAPGPSSYDADVFAQIINIVHNDLF